VLGDVAQPLLAPADTGIVRPARVGKPLLADKQESLVRLTRTSGTVVTVPPLPSTHTGLSALPARATHLDQQSMKLLA
jgi:hypothetical protein